MKEDTIRGLFQLFGNTKMNNHINEAGIGLGLTVSAQLCKKLGGNLYVERSEPLKGSKLTFFLPIQLIIQPSFLNASIIGTNSVGSFMDIP
jgi:signal transduction histidine kinase